MENSINNENNVFMSSKERAEKPLIHSKSDNRETMTDNDTYEVIQERFNFVSNRCQAGLEQSMRAAIVSLIMFRCYITNAVR